MELEYPNTKIIYSDMLNFLEEIIRRRRNIEKTKYKLRKMLATEWFEKQEDQTTE